MRSMTEQAHTSGMSTARSLARARAVRPWTVVFTIHVHRRVHACARVSNDADGDSRPGDVQSQAVRKPERPRLRCTSLHGTATA